MMCCTDQFFERVFEVLGVFMGVSNYPVKECNIENISSNNDAKINELVSCWIVSESKSLIDDSPGVTMFRMTESGN